MQDLIIVGGGPIGLAVGIEAQKAGLNFQILEKGTLANSIYHYPQNMRFFSSSEKLEIGGVPFVSQMPKPDRNEALEYYRRVCQHFDLPLETFVEVQEIEKTAAGHFLLQTSAGPRKTRFLCVATGFYDRPRKLNIPGEDLAKLSHYYSDPLAYFRKKVAVVGAANSAIDAALECWRKGAAEVRLIIRGKEISPRVKYWVRPDIENRIAEGSIIAHYNSKVSAVYPDSIDIETKGRVEQFENDFVLALVGYQPNFGLLDKLGLAYHDGPYRAPVYHPETMESNVSGLFLAGVLCGGLETHKWFIENSRDHAPLIARAIQLRLKE